MFSIVKCCKFNIVFCLFLFVFISKAYSSFNNQNFYELQSIVSYSNAVKKAAPSVVSVQTTHEMPLCAHPMFNDPIFNFFFGENLDECDKKLLAKKKRLLQGLGSGVIIDQKGYVITNNHVIKDSKEIFVKLPCGIVSKTEILCTDIRTDLAILQIKNEDVLGNLPVIEMGDSDNVDVGDIVLAIGNPFGFDNTVTQGIISGLGSVAARCNEQYVNFGSWLDNLIQTDAAINPGNSGGALIDMQGRLIGINLAIVSRSGGSQGIGFAIPINLAKHIMKQLIGRGYIVRGWLGAELNDINEALRAHLGFNEEYGVYVKNVIKNSPAQKNGILPGDIIVKINDINIKSVGKAINIVGLLEPNNMCSIEIFRKFKFITFSMLIDQLPQD